MNRELFTQRPARLHTCPQCQGSGSINEGYALAPSDMPLRDTPEDAIGAIMVGSSHVSEATREAAEIAQRARRPVVFQCRDHVVVVHPGDDPEQVSRAWWFRQYGEAPEVTMARR